MSNLNTQTMLSASEDGWLRHLIETPALSFSVPAISKPKARLIRLDEINEEGHQAYRQALTNVYATLDSRQNVRLLYMVDGSPSGVALYFGVVADTDGEDIHEAMKNLRGALEGHLPGINFGEEVTPTTRDALIANFCSAPHQGVMMGAPTGQSQDERNEDDNFQGLDRLVRALQSGSGSNTQANAGWKLAVVSQPFERQQIRQMLDDAYALSSQLAILVRTSVQSSGNSSRQKNVSTGSSQSIGSNEGFTENRGKSESGTEGKNCGTSKNSNSSSSSSGQNSGSSQSKTFSTNEGTSKNTGTSSTASTSENLSLSDTEGSSLGFTQEIANKRAHHLVEYLDKQLITRLQKGLTRGLFHTGVYFTADNNSTYQRLKNTLRATYQGSETTLSPLEVYDLPKATHGQLMHLPRIFTERPSQELLFHSLKKGANNTLGSLLTADELAIVASLPQNEIQGVRRKRTVDFVVDLPDVASESSLDLGCIINSGRRYLNNRVRLSKSDLNKHVFITGVTGAGKTTTCLNLLLESDLPFLVIEPAKTEYRELANRLDLVVDYYRPNGDVYQSLRINPFALVRKEQRIKSHAGFLKNAFAAVFPMEASMPMMVEAAILASYEEKGWDIDENEYLPGDDPFEPMSRAWPTMSDMVRQLDLLIPTFGLGKDFEEKYRGSLVSRLRSLTDGTLGRVLDVPQSIDFNTLLERHSVIELEELQGGEEKALLMALLLGAINETMRAKHAKNPDFRQLTLIEEAHRLLSRPEPGDKAAALAVESFADMLAEVRKYGTGLIIADQIPAKLIPDVIKNTHCKIVHRLFAEDDRRAMGEAMMMDEAQRNFLPNLATGEAIVFCGGWHGSAHAAIRNDRAQTDNRQEFDLNSRSIRQLWRERSRYYPHFSSLTWLSVNEADAGQFAEFVRTTRQAQNQLLQMFDQGSKTLVMSNHPQLPRAEAVLIRIKKWLAEWLVITNASQQEYKQWHTKSHGVWPSDLLATAWVALLCDANPRPHASAKNAPMLLKPSEREFICSATEQLIDILQESKDIADMRGQIQSKNTDLRDLQSHFENLSFFKSF